MASNNLVIEKSKLLLVEGKDEVIFFYALLSWLDIDTIQVIDVAGKDGFRTVLPSLLNLPGFDKVGSYGIIRDADDHPDQALASVLGVLQANSQPSPLRHGSFSTGSYSGNEITVGVFIMPGQDENGILQSGMLESLCLRVLNSHPIEPCVSAYLDCLSQIQHDSELHPSWSPPVNRVKAKLLAFFSGMKEFVGSLGLASQKGYFDFASSELNEIKEFLSQI